jgi:uncharacterized GH25 family protein
MLVAAAIVSLAAMSSWQCVAVSAEPEAELAAHNSASRREFSLQVLGPNQKPVPNAEVQFRGTPALRPEHVVQGEHVRQNGSANLRVKAGRDGRLVVSIPAKPKYFTVQIEQPGFAPYWAEWNSYNRPMDVPSDHVAELDPAWAVSGIVVDADGKPVEGVEVHVSSIKFKKRPGDFNELYVGTQFKTPPDGTWQYGCVPDSMDSVLFTFNHPKFMTERATLTRGQYDAAGDGKIAARIELKPGLTVKGKITDENGQPISNALVRTKFLNEEREARTDDAGDYELVGCEPRTVRIVVSAPGKALDMKQLRVAPDMEPVDFQLKPGGHLRVVAMDENGKPIPKTRIFFQQWRGRIEYFEFDHVNQYADTNGVWEWNEAPHDAIVADICRPNGMQLVDQTLTARDEEYIFKPPKALVVSGSVIDAETKQPVKKFRVIPGIRWPNNPAMHWSQQQGFDAADGKYSIRENRQYIAHGVRIEAVGYKAGVSRDIKYDEGDITINFELERGKNLAATVLDSDGQPAAGAEVAIGVAGSQININNGDIDDGSTYHATRIKTDDNGKFSLPPQEGDFHIVVTHKSGFGVVKATADSAPETIRLTAWGRVEGEYRVGDEPLTNAMLELSSNALSDRDPKGPNIFTSYKAATGPDGKFVFERVFPGRGWVGRQLVYMVNEGATEVGSSKQMPFDVAAGETREVNVGGNGIVVVGQLVPAKGVKGKVEWQFASMYVRVATSQVPRPKIPVGVLNDPKLREAWVKEWMLTPEGMAWRDMNNANQRLMQDSPNFRVSVDRDGTFRIDDVPPGSYTMNIDFQREGPAAGQLRDYKFTVPDGANDPTSELDLGLIELD